MAETSFQRIAFVGLRAALLANSNFATLTGSRLYRDLVPQSLTTAQVYPCGILAYGGISQTTGEANYGSQVSIINNDRVGVWLTISFRAVGMGEHLAKLDEIAAEADKTLHKMAKRTVTGGLIQACVFRNVIDYSAPSKDGAQTMYFNGGFYEVLVSKS